MSRIGEVLSAKKEIEEVNWKVDSAHRNRKGKDRE